MTTVVAAAAIAMGVTTVIGEVGAMVTGRRTGTRRVEGGRGVVVEVEAEVAVLVLIGVYFLLRFGSRI